MIVFLPWPDKRLSPNARVHRMQRANVAKGARTGAYYETLQQIGPKGARGAADGDGRLHLTITFCPPDKRRRDLDNMLAANKANLDGFADALGVDDHRFELTLKRGEPVKLGRVEIAL